MLAMNEALKIIKDNCFPVETETVKITSGLNRIISEGNTPYFDERHHKMIFNLELTASYPLPPFPASIKDGYAVHSADGAGIRKVITAVTAGDQRTSIDVPRGHCVRINTGAPVPPSCDAVIQVEDTKIVRKSPQGEELEIALQSAVSPGNDIRPVGSDIELGMTHAF